MDHLELDKVMTVAIASVSDGRHPKTLRAAHFPLCVALCANVVFQTQ
jgi:hypothetical protein